jgi:arylsulfatase A-like enzyme
MWDHTYANMLNMLDSHVKNVTDALQRTGLWENTLLVFTADNGGIDRGNSHPLRGHKHDPWEGGTRATAFAAGGLIPPPLRGTNSGDKLVHVSDW